MDKIHHLSLPKHARIIVISDIHGELQLLKKLLEKVNYSKEDYLIINGDMCEKGHDSQGVVQYVMALYEQHPHVYVTEGNCDTLVEDLLQENQELIDYLCKRRHSILNEWLDELGITVIEKTRVQEIKKVLTQHFPREIKWLCDLPTAIETEDYIFVHAGLADIKHWKDTERLQAIRMPAFLDKSHQTEKFVVVGHWPVVNYPSDIPSHNPIIDLEKKIIAMDGGNVVKNTGQLNAFIIDRNSDGDQFSFTYVDHFKASTILKDYKAERAMKGSIVYPFYNIVPLEKNQHFTLCRQQETDQLFYVKNEYIKQDGTGIFVVKTDVSCAQLSVGEGDLVSIVDDTCTGYTLVKKDGLEGWLPKSILGE